jgi:serine/threonine protein kinase
MAPEIFKKSGHGKPVDVWALGVITYFLLCGYTPFDRDSSVEEMQAIMAGDYSFEPPEYWEDVSEKAKDFIRGCLTVDPEKRLTAKQCVNHPWLSLEVPVEKEADLLPTVRQNFNARRSVPSLSPFNIQDIPRGYRRYQSNQLYEKRRRHGRSLQPLSPSSPRQSRPRGCGQTTSRFRRNSTISTIRRSMGLRLITTTLRNHFLFCVQCWDGGYESIINIGVR